MDKVSPFQITIPKFKEVPEGKKTVTFYCIEVKKRGSDKWVIDKRYREFDELLAALKKVYSNLPNLPGKTLFSLKTSDQIDKRRSDLETFLQAIVSRTDLISSEQVKRFLQLDNFAPETAVTPPKHINDLSSLVLGCRDFIYEQKEGLLFVAISDMNFFSRVDSGLTNTKMPWEKDLPPGTKVTVGAVEAYIQKDAEEFVFEKLWTKTFQTQVIGLYWEASSNILCVGKDDGSLTFMKVAGEVNFIKYDEILTSKVHTQRVMGVYLDPITQYSYSCSEDKKFKVFDINKNFTIADIPIGSEKHTCLTVCKESKRAFVANRSGQVFLYDISNKDPILIHSILTHDSKNANLRALLFDPKTNYLFAANYKDGVIAVWDLQKPGKEKFAGKIANLHGKPEVRVLSWSSSRYEIYSGNEDGTITFWSVRNASPIYALKAHQGGICKFHYLEKQNVLMSGAKDKKIRFYQLPDEWRDKRMEAEMLKEHKTAKQAESLYNFKKAQQAAEDDSDEDDLLGWHK